MSPEDLEEQHRRWRQKAVISGLLLGITIMALLFNHLGGCSRKTAPKVGDVIGACGDLQIGQVQEASCPNGEGKEISICTGDGLQLAVSCLEPPDESLTFKSRDNINADILRDLTALDERGRPNTVYLVTSHKLNEGGDLELAEQAIRKSLVSTTLERRIYEPVPIDKEKTIWRLDLEELGINAQERKLIEGEEPINIVDESGAGSLVRLLAKSNQPWFHAENWIDTTNKANVYYDLLDIPTQFGQFVQQLGVNFSGDLQNGDALLVGFNGSRISANAQSNRLVGRFESRDGFFHISFDPLAQNGVAARNLFNNPLLAQTGSRRVFDFAASEVLFTLPNGAMGAALFAANGQRQDAAPQTIVQDRDSPITTEIQNAISCYRCHASGIIPIRDEIRDHVRRNASQFLIADREIVAELYKTQATVDQLIDLDNATFGDAMAKAGVDFSQDPINLVRDSYRLNWDLKRTAAFLFLTDDELVQAINESPASLQQIGQLLSGGTATFEQFVEALPQLIIDARLFQDPIGSNQ